MGIEPYTLKNLEKKADRINDLNEEKKSIREKMEAEAHTFIEATKKISIEWIQREMNSNMPQINSEICPENIEGGKDIVRKLLHLEDLPSRIQDSVQEHLNLDNYWIHRNELLHADISRDYIEFKKEKIRKDLTSSIRMVLGCAAEIFADVKDEKTEDKVWVRERGRRKYICILRFSDEMTASLDRYFSMLEKLFVFEYEIERIKKEAEGREDKTEPEKP